MPVRNCWYVAGWDYEFAPGTLASRTILGEPIALWRGADGAWTALEDRCCHRLAPLSAGRLEGDHVRCMYHGLKFDRAGCCVEIPGQERIPAQARVRTYPVIERHSWVWIWMGDPAAADPALVPAAVGLDDPGWMLQSGQLDYAAGYELINDNLLDFTHLSFVHENTLGKGTDYRRRQPTVTPLPRGVRVSRWVDGSARASELERIGRLGDQWSTYDYLLPGILLLGGGSYPAGTALRFPDGPPPGLAPLGTSFSSQAVTPVTETSSRYFFSWGLPRAVATEELVGGMMALAKTAFLEDKAMIEAQQRILAVTPEPRMVATASDAALFQFRRLMERMAAAESGDTPLRAAAGE